MASFEADLERALGERIRTDDDVACAVWSALANIDWIHESGDIIGYTFRSAGGLIAEIRREGSYLDWYCCGPVGVVSLEITEAMSAEGWSYRTLDPASFI